MSEAEIKPQVIESPEIKQLQQYELLRQILLIVFVSTVVSVCGQLVVKFFFEKEIIAVDLRVIMSKELEKTATQILTPEQRDSRAKAFNKALEAALDHVSNNGRKIILVSPAVVNGVSDYTQNVIEEIPKLIEAREKKLAKEAE